jgi:pSer/pThr/pTyr-binding forkhead associated (FHA) protein
MPESLLVWFNLFTEDPGLVRGRLNGRPVLLYEPLAVVIEKTKDNAFQRRITVGRTANNDIVLDDQSVSRFHAYLQQDERHEWTLTDAGSRNGSFVSGRRLAPRTPAPLANAAVVRIGAVQLTFYSAQGFLDLLKRRANG